MSTTDIIVCVLLLIFVRSGWRKGFFRSFISPFSLAAAILVGAISFDLTNKLLQSISLGLTTLLLANILLRLLWLWGRFSVEKNYRNFLFIGSRILGTMISLAWKGSVLILILLCMALLPMQRLGLGDLQEDVKASKTFFYMNNDLLNHLPLTQNLLDHIASLKDFSASEDHSEDNRFQSLLANKKLQSLLEDPEIQQQLKSHDLSELVNNPKLIDLVNDKNFFDEVSEMGKKALPYPFSSPHTPSYLPMQK